MNPVSDRIAFKSTPAALVLMGGGARAAYQVGVLKAIAAILREVRRGLDPSISEGHNPFPILVGTSAGAINAAALACRADNFQEAVAQIVDTWENIHAEQVYRSDVFGVVRSGARWLTLLSIGWMVRRSLRLRPRSLLDNAPLGALLEALIDHERLSRALERGHLKALAITASSYSSGRHVTFYQCLNDAEFASKLQRVAVRTPIDIPHLLASSAIPFVFPAVCLDAGPGIGQEFFGDGSMRQLSPISPAIHLGAQRILIIGVGQMGRPGVLQDVDAHAYPSLAQVAGHALATIFLDALASDVERLERMNALAAGMSANQQHAFQIRPIQSLVIAPTERLDGLATRYVAALPRPVRAMLEVLGSRGGAALVSYILFESAYTKALIDLGHQDAMNRREALLDFLTEPRAAPPAPAQSRVVVL